MFNRLGMVLPSLAPSQLAFSCVRETNQFLANNAGFDFSLFVEEWTTRCIQPHFGTFEIQMVSAYPGVLLATTLSTARHVIDAMSAQSRYFYVWDLEWMRGQNEYGEMNEVYSSPLIHLLARSDEHAHAIEKMWNRKVHAVVPEFSMAKLCDVCFNQLVESV